MSHIKDSWQYMYRRTLSDSDFKIDDLDENIINSPRQRQPSAESISSSHPFIDNLFEVIRVKEEDPNNINIYRVSTILLYFLRAFSCWNDKRCYYDPLNDWSLLLLANLDISWGYDFYNIFEYLSEPRRLVRNYNHNIRFSALAMVLRIHGAYQLQQQLGSAMAEANVSPLMTQIIACCALEAYAKTFVAINTKLRFIEEVQPVALPVLFRQVTGQHDNSSDDEFEFSNPNTPTPSASPATPPALQL